MMKKSQRKLTVSTSIAALEWKKNKINLFDTPGFNIFINDTYSTMIADDAKLVVVDAVAGVEVQTEKTWSFSDEFHLPRAILINKLDRERADFDRAVASVQDNFGRTAIPIQLPIGAEKDFKGVIDLIRMKAYTLFARQRRQRQGIDIPAEYAEAAKTAHEALVEIVAEGNDALLEEFFAVRHAALRTHRRGLHAAVKELRIFPILCASALHNIGADRILDFFGETFPAPTDHAARSRQIERPGCDPRDQR